MCVSTSPQGVKCSICISQICILLCLRLPTSELPKAITCLYVTTDTPKYFDISSIEMTIVCVSLSKIKAFHLTNATVSCHFGKSGMSYVKRAKFSTMYLMIPWRMPCIKGYEWNKVKEATWATSIPCFRNLFSDLFSHDFCVRKAQFETQIWLKGWEWLIPFCMRTIILFG